MDIGESAGLDTTAARYGKGMMALMYQQQYVPVEIALTVKGS